MLRFYQKQDGASSRVVERGGFRLCLGAKVLTMDEENVVKNGFLAPHEYSCAGSFPLLRRVDTMRKHASDNI